MAGGCSFVHPPLAHLVTCLDKPCSALSSPCLLPPPALLGHVAESSGGLAFHLQQRWWPPSLISAPLSLPPSLLKNPCLLALRLSHFSKTPPWHTDPGNPRLGSRPPDSAALRLLAPYHTPLLSLCHRTSFGLLGFIPSLEGFLLHST